MTRVARTIDRIVGMLCTLGVAAAALMLLVSFALVAYSVFMRYVLNQPIPWVDELVGYLLVAIVMLAAADALRRGEHIAVDLLTSRLKARNQRRVAAAGLVAVAVAGLALLLGGWETAQFTKMLGIVSTGYLTMPMHLPQMLIPVGGALLLVAALGGLLRLAIGETPTVSHSGDDRLTHTVPPPGTLR
jgi:C4-dicarboxylate transporter, DctQ subunit